MQIPLTAAWLTMFACNKDVSPNASVAHHMPTQGHVVQFCAFDHVSLLMAVVVMQASANTLLAHFVSIVFTNILLRMLNKATPDPKTAY